jgi:hypothetical protein
MDAYVAGESPAWAWIAACAILLGAGIAIGWFAAKALRVAALLEERNRERVRLRLAEKNLAVQATTYRIQYRILKRQIDNIERGRPTRPEGA